MKVQVYKSKSLSATKVTNNILRIWKDTSPEERQDWYLEAHNWAINLSQESEIPLPHVCGVIAALSPVKTWEQNLVCATQMIKTGHCGHIKLFKDKALDIIGLPNSATTEDILQILNGNKIKSFFINILYPQRSTEVTIDRHALSVALGHWITDDEYQGITSKQYKFFVDCYVRAARKVGVTPLIMQSATWVRFRKIKSQYR